jgi:AcrR family transcriptional regulator
VESEEQPATLCAIPDNEIVLSGIPREEDDSTVHGGRTKDRRIQKTEALLREALAGLIREKPYDDIVVKEILARANVGRSTFYTHFRDKDELLLSSIHDMLNSARPAGERGAPAKPWESIVWFSLPILEHIEGHRRTGGSTMGPEGRGVLHEHLQHAITELIEEEVRTALRRRRMESHASPELLVHWIASTFTLVLNWWVESNSPLPARDADRLFRGLIEPSLAGLLS